MIDDPEVTVFVSAASAWEITTKYRLGKLPHDHAGFAADVDGALQKYGFTALPITLLHAQRAGALPGPHKDPFDRMLVAQALSDRMPIASNEGIFDHYGVVRIW
jgi:PIN domain nuclease of toxin-antitoxin system